MARIIDAFTQFLDDNGNPLANGWLKFLESGTNNTDKDTFADSQETIANANPLQLDGAGRCPNVFGSGSYRVISYANNVVSDVPGVQIQQFDPVSTGQTASDFSDWDTLSTYSQTDIVKGSDNLYYQSLTSGNQGNDPTTDAVNWERIDFTRFWNMNKTYSENERVLATDGKTYRSLVDSNLNNDPTSSPSEWVTTLESVPDASETVKGIAEIATQTETDTGTDDAKFVTPLKLENIPWKPPTLQKVVEIGDWDMDATATATIAHGLDATKIRDVSVFIVADGSSLRYSAPRVTSAGIDAVGVQEIGSSQITLARTTGGFFDSVLFDQTSFNRGWVVIDYIA